MSEVEGCDEYGILANLEREAFLSRGGITDGGTIKVVPNIGGNDSDGGSGSDLISSLEGSLICLGCSDGD